jgi:peptidoglycan-N-acetylglucosamine deacetylase
MLNFRNTNIVFVLLFAMLIVAHLFYGIPLYLYFLLLFIYSLIVFYGCINIRSNFFVKAICAANIPEKEIAISFDDGPVATNTAAILEILQQQNIKAVFFCIGSRIAGHEDILKQIYSAGHIIGNHSYSHHFWFDMFSSKKMLNDLRQMDDEVKKVIGIKPTLFRPPYGVTNPNLKTAIVKGKYSAIGWSVRSMDTVIKDEKKLLTKVTAAIQPGAVFLFHDTSIATIKMLPTFLQEVKKRGYNIVPLDKLLHLKPYE